MTKGQRTYSFGNSPRAKEHSSDVFPHAPVQPVQLKARVLIDRLHAVTDDNQFSSYLETS